MIVKIRTSNDPPTINPSIRCLGLSRIREPESTTFLAESDPEKTSFGGKIDLEILETLRF
jgi:hypothetical protein